MLVDTASNTLYAHNDFNTGAGPWLRWFPYPTSNTFMCAYVHIPTVDNGGYVYYQGGANNKSSGTIYQADYSNWWWYAYTDYYGYYNGMQINSDSANQFHSNTYAADAVSFHYPSC